jgi:hypothetical protein
MKTYQKLASMGVVAWAAAQTTLIVRAESTASEPAAETAPPVVETNRHLMLCAMLGLKVGSNYEFMLTGNDGLHYWQIVSLGGNGWILARDSRYPATWVNLSQVIAVTPIPLRPGEERPKKSNRAD